MKKLLEAFRRRQVRRRHRYIIRRIENAGEILRSITNELEALDWKNPARKVQGARFDLATAQALAESQSVCHPNAEFKWPRA